MTGTKKCEVHIISDAEDDIFDIYRYVARNDSVKKAENLLEDLEKTILTLQGFPGRGHLPPELERIAVYDYLEIHCKPYRIIYHIAESDVLIHCVLDGRRDVQDILERRLLRSPGP